MTGLSRAVGGRLEHVHNIALRATEECWLEHSLHPPHMRGESSGTGGVGAMLGQEQGILSGLKPSRKEHVVFGVSSGPCWAYAGPMFGVC